MKTFVVKYKVDVLDDEDPIDYDAILNIGGYDAECEEVPHHIESKALEGGAKKREPRRPRKVRRT